MHSYSFSIWSTGRIVWFKTLTRVCFARDYIFFKGPNNVIGLYWRLKFEWEQFCVEITQPLDFVMIFFGQVVDL